MLVPEYKDEQIIEILKRWNYKKIGWKCIYETFKVSKNRAKKIAKLMNKSEPEGAWIVICQRCGKAFFTEKYSDYWIYRVCKNCMPKLEREIDVEDWRRLVNGSKKDN